jgi:Heterokaryon incompatibility protein (HET)
VDKHTGDPANNIVEDVLCSPIVDLESRHRQAVAWKTECENEHGVCKGLGDGPLPTRVLDLGSTVDAGQLNLREDLNGRPGRYACLSYCWGSAQDVTTRTNTIDGFRRGISKNSLPKTIRDAIDVTRALGIRFLWIDALCILQDSEVDKSRECSQMDQIYQRAFVTISAASAENCHRGFSSGAGSMVADFPKLPITCPDGRLGSIFVLPEKQNLFEDPIQTRAWTLQEHVLSPRLLIWSKYQLFWLCTNGLSQEQDGSHELAGPYYRRPDSLFGASFDKRVGQRPDESTLIGLHESLSGRAPAADGYYAFQYAPDFVHDEMQAVWERVMVEYSKRRLSVKSDKLPALSGLASRFREFVQDEYLAGHWRRWLLPHLLWKCVDEKGGVRLPDEDGVPSWSWLSVNGPVSVNNLSSTDIIAVYARAVASIVNCETIPLFENAPYGQIKSGHLLIRGYLKAVAVNTKTRHFDLRHPYVLTPTERRLPKITLDDPSSFWNEMIARELRSPSGSALPSTVWCLPLYLVDGEGGDHDAVVRGIVLVKGGRNQLVHKRVGWFFGGDAWCYKEQSHDWPEKDILIA